MSKSTSRYRNGGQDKYYTTPQVALDLTDKLSAFLTERDLLNTFEHIIEPSAGAGSFLKPIRSFGKPVSAIDVKPDHPDIEFCDFFDFQNSDKALYVGNPPFGHAAHLAVKFFNHAAKNGAEIIAFVLPKSFRKQSVQDRLQRHFHLEFEHDVPSHGFLLDGQQHDVPCIFQIWGRSNQLRSTQTKRSSEWIKFTHPNDADHAMRRVGRRAGDLLKGTNHSRSTTHFFKVTHPDVLELLRENEEIKALCQNTAGVHSISKSEVLKIVDRGMAGKV